MSITLALLFSFLGLTHQMPSGPIISKDYDHEVNRPTVKIIKEGYIECYLDGSCEKSSNVVYIHDGPECQIIVDTGLPSDIRSILRNLADNDVLPTAITLVVSSHLHPDHIGNLNIYSYATYVFSNYSVDFHTLAPLPVSSDQGSDQQVRFLCPNVALVRVRGHTADDSVVLVFNATDYGNVSVTGDIFISADDLEDENIWITLSAYPDDQRLARRMIIADSDYIIPGHGKGFRVTDQIRDLVYNQSDEECTCASKYGPPTLFGNGPPEDIPPPVGGGGTDVDEAPFDLSSHPALQNFSIPGVAEMNQSLPENVSLPVNVSLPLPPPPSPQLGDPDTNVSDPHAGHDHL